METNKVIRIITEHNKWRRGQGKYGKPGAKSPNTCLELGVALDQAVNILECHIGKEDLGQLVKLAREKYAEYRVASRNRGKRVPRRYARAMKVAKAIIGKMVRKGK